MIASIVAPALFAFLLIFCRVGSGMMLLPGIGEAYISPTIRMAFAMLVAVVMTPALAETLPPAPSTALGLATLLAAEIMVGGFIGLLCRVMLSAMHTAGTILSMQSGLSSAMMFDVTQSSQGSLLGNLLSMSAVAFWFALDFHHLMFSALFDSYSLFPPGQMLPMGDVVNMYAKLMGEAFSIAMQMSAPIVLIMMLLNFGGGLLARLMPAMQIFYLLLPIQLLLTFFIMRATASGFFIGYLRFAEDHLVSLINP